MYRSIAILLCQRCCNDTRSKVSDELSQCILTALASMPGWLRRDLSSKDDANRQSAEESIAANLATALGMQSRA